MTTTTTTTTTACCWIAHIEDRLAQVRNRPSAGAAVRSRWRPPPPLVPLVHGHHGLELRVLVDVRRDLLFHGHVERVLRVHELATPRARPFELLRVELVHERLLAAHDKVRELLDVQGARLVIVQGVHEVVQVLVVEVRGRDLQDLADDDHELVEVERAAGPRRTA